VVVQAVAAGAEAEVEVALGVADRAAACSAVAHRQAIGATV